jgi:hypothetical protein
VSDLTGCFDFSKATPSGPPPPALQSAFVASQALFATNNSGDETPPANQAMPKQETTPARRRVGPVPAYLASPASRPTKKTTKPAAPEGAPTSKALAATGGLPAAETAVALVVAGAGVAKLLSHQTFDPSIVLADRMEDAMRSVSRKRSARGGTSDSTRAGGHLPKWVEPREPDDLEGP